MQEFYQLFHRFEIQHEILIKNYEQFIIFQQFLVKKCPNGRIHLFLMDAMIYSNY